MATGANQSMETAGQGAVGAMGRWVHSQRPSAGHSASGADHAGTTGSAQHPARNHRAHREESSPTMKVWIDQDLCTGDGLCEEIAPDVFALLDDGLAYVKDGDKILSDPAGAEAVAPVPAGQEEATIESAEECPGECIYIEVD